MKARAYKSKVGKYMGMWHVRLYDNGKYIHIGRYRTKSIADKIVSELNQGD